MQRWEGGRKEAREGEREEEKRKRGKESEGREEGRKKQAKRAPPPQKKKNKLEGHFPVYYLHGNCIPWYGSVLGLTSPSILAQYLLLRAFPRATEGGLQKLLPT